MLFASSMLRRLGHKVQKQIQLPFHVLGHGLGQNLDKQKKKIKSNTIQTKNKIKSKKTSKKTFKKTSKKRKRVKPALTEPKSPSICKLKRRHSIKSSIIRELEHINSETKKFQQLRALNAKTAQSLYHSFSRTHPVRSIKTLTKPHQFSLYTAARAKIRNEPAVGKKHLKGDTTCLQKEAFFESLRSSKLACNSIITKALTVPVGPKLMKRLPMLRQLPQSSEEKELEKIRKCKFKAQPVPHKILSNKKIRRELRKRPLTCFQEFKLSKSNVQKCWSASPAKVFKSTLDRKIFTGDNRIQVAARIKAKKRQVTRPIEFHLSTSKKQKKEPKKPQSTILNNIRQVKRKGKQSLTKPKPFSFMMNNGKKELRKRLEAEIAMEKENVENFKARPIPSSQANPFVVKKSVKALTISNSPQLYSTIRSNHRKTFNQEVVERNRYQLQQKEFEEQLSKKKEKTLVRKLRSRMIHHPVKIPDLKSPPPRRHSNVPLTVAESPLLWTKMRKQSRYYFCTPPSQRSCKRFRPR